MNQRFENAAVVVTGAANGIGRAVAVAFAREGARVTVSDVNEGGGHATVSPIEDSGGEAVFAHAGVSAPAQAQALIDGAAEKWERLGVVANSTGVGGTRAPTAEYPDDDWMRTLSVNAGGAFYGTKHALRHLLPAGRLATVEEVTSAILYLCAPEARFLTGVALTLDGGLTAV